jgi:signal transduction histidine kinase
VPGLTGQWALALLAAASLVLVAIVAVVARKKLRRADERLRVGERALDAVPHAVFVVDALRPGRPNLYVNAAYAALTGHGAREAVGANFDALSIFADAATVASLDDRPPPAAGQRVNIRRRDGTVFPAKLDLRVLPRDDGGRYVIGLLEGLESGERSADRTPAARPAVAHTSDHAASPATDAFLSWLIHELRSPLNACVMWLDVLALAPEPDKLAKAVEALKRNLARQARLVSDLNDAAKISAGGEMRRRERFDLVALLKSSLDAWQLLAAGKQLEVHSRIELEAAPIEGDSELLAKALSHLIENAISSTPTAGRLDLRVQAAGENCVVEVEDTGAALSDEDAAHLSTPLWRAPTSAKGRAGLGLGLAVAHRVAVEHGGTLTAANGVAGARFVLTLPLAAAPAPA